MKKLFFFFLCLICSQTFALTKVRLALDWFVNPNHAPLFVAKEMGFFKEEGLDIEFIGPADSADPPKWVASKKVDIAITYEPQFMLQVDQGLPLIQIGTLIDQPLNCLVVLDNSINSLRDLKNKTIGRSSSSSMNSVMLSTMLSANKISADQINTLNIHYSLTQALLAKRVDGVTGMMRNFEVIQLKLAGATPKVFLPEHNGIPPYSELIFVANKNSLNKNTIQKFLRALNKGEKYLKAHPGEMWNAFKKAYPELDNELNKQAWLATLPYFTNKPDYLDQQKWLEFAKFLQKNGLISKVQPIAQYSALVKG